jgi:acetylglutamate kinase
LNSKLQKHIVVKLGGSIFDSRDTTIEDVVCLQKQGLPLVLVHGGANIVTRWLERQEKTTQFFEGERITDKAGLDMVTAVLAGLVNKEITAAIIAAGGQAVGISGVDGALIQARIRNQKMGYTGNVVRINQAPLVALMDAGFIPVVAPVSLYSFGRPEGAPLLLNVNGDTVAGEIAAAISAEKLVLLTDVNGIRNGAGELVPALSPVEARALLDSGVVQGGMIPKIRACLRATSDTSTVCIIIDGQQPHALLRAVEAGDCGTSIESAGETT